MVANSTIDFMRFIRQHQLPCTLYSLHLLLIEMDIHFEIYPNVHSPGTKFFLTGLNLVILSHIENSNGKHPNRMKQSKTLHDKTKTFRCNRFIKIIMSTHEWIETDGRTAGGRVCERARLNLLYTHR